MVYVLTGVFVLALGARVLSTERGGGLHGLLGYDDGVYFASAAGLVSGRLPYRDFVLLHPPGIAVVLAPFAWLARGPLRDGDAFALARLVFMGIGAVNALLAGLMVRRLGLAAVGTAGVTYGVARTTVFAERSTTLETLVNLGVLIALVLVADGRAAPRRLFVAGLAMGFAVAVKLWAVVPLVVVFGWLLAVSRGRRLAGYLAGATVSAGLLVLPLFLLAPSAMFRMIVLDQVGRPRSGTVASRLANVTGLALRERSVSPMLATVTLVVCAVLAAGVVFALRRAATRLWGILLVAQVSTLLAVNPYFPHYGSFAAPAVAAVAGTTAATAARHLRAALALAGPPPGSRWRARLAAAAVCLLLAVAATPALRMRSGHRVAESALAILQDPACVSTDSPAVLVLADRLSRDLAAGCPFVDDVTGLTYEARTRTRRSADVGMSDPVWNLAAVDYLRSGSLAAIARGNGRRDRRFAGWQLVQRTSGIDVYRPPT